MKSIEKVYISKKLNKIGCCCGCQGDYWYASTATSIPPIFKTKVNDAMVEGVAKMIAAYPNEVKRLVNGADELDSLELVYPNGKHQLFVAFYTPDHDRIANNN